MSTHTPGPWAAYQKQGQQGTPLPQWRIHGPGICGAIATVDFDLTQPTCAKQDANVAANAAYIVRACNAHEEMLEALKELVAEHDETDQNDTGGIILARQAIAKAEGAATYAPR